jgi:primary-amine oxidase
LVRGKHDESVCRSCTVYNVPDYSAVLIILLGVSASAAHPLDSLSSEEIATAAAVLRDAGDIDAATRFALIDLDEPPKPEIISWKPTQPFARKAFVVARRDRTVYEAVVDLGNRKVERWEAIRGVQSGLVSGEIEDGGRIARADPGWKAAMRKRGYAAFDNLFCPSLSAGYFADPAEESRRLVRVACFDTAGSRINWWGRPVEGLYAVVDLDEKTVVRLIDTGEIPVSHETHEFKGVQDAPAVSSAKRSFTLARTLP